MVEMSWVKNHHIFSQGQFSSTYQSFLKNPQRICTIRIRQDLSKIGILNEKGDQSYDKQNGEKISV